MRYAIPTVLTSVSMLISSNAFADPCGDAVCWLAGRAGSALGTGGILGLLAVGAAVLGLWFYGRRDKVDGGAAPERTRDARV